MSVEYCVRVDQAWPMADGHQNRESGGVVALRVALQVDRRILHRPRSRVRRHGHLRECRLRAMAVSRHIRREQADLAYDLHKFAVASWTRQTSVCSVPLVIALVADNSLAFDSIRHRNMRAKGMSSTTITSGDGSHALWLKL